MPHIQLTTPCLVTVSLHSLRETFFSHFFWIKIASLETAFVCSAGSWMCDLLKEWSKEWVQIVCLNGIVSSYWLQPNFHDSIAMQLNFELLERGKIRQMLTTRSRKSNHLMVSIPLPIRVTRQATLWVAKWINTPQIYIKI